MTEIASYLAYGIAGITVFLLMFCVWSLLYAEYKEREWRRNNPDEHNIMERKIKDDFSDLEK